MILLANTILALVACAAVIVAIHAEMSWLRESALRRRVEAERDQFRDTLRVIRDRGRVELPDEPESHVAPMCADEGVVDLAARRQQRSAAV